MPPMLLCAALLALAAPTLENPGFEAGAPGKPPPGWALRDISAAQGFTARLAGRGAARGKQCLEIARADSRTFGHYATVSQSVPAADVRGKRVRFSASVRTDGLTGFSAAGLFARAHRPDFRPGHCAE